MEPKAPFARCKNCPLNEMPFVPGSGENGKVDVVIVGEAPGRTEAQQGTPFVGPSGQILRRTLDSFGGLKVWITNIELCRPPNNEFDSLAAECCRERLLEEIKLHDPDVVLSLGNEPTDALLGSGKGITKRRGLMRHNDELDVDVMPTFHPAYVLRVPAVYSDFASDVEEALDPSKRSAFTEPVGPELVSIGRTVEDQLQILDKFDQYEWIAYDLETSSLRPHEGNILCLVLSHKKGEAAVLQGKALRSPPVKKRLGEFFSAGYHKFVGHNAKFDDRFLKVHLGVDPNLAWDTMLGSYVLDERRGLHGLKFLAARRCEAPDWEEPIEEALDEADSESYADVPEDMLFKYAAWDGDYTYRLLMDQQEQFKEYPRQKALMEDLLIPASKALAEVENRGMLVDRERLQEAVDEYKGEVDALRDELREISGDKELNPNSYQQVAHILYDEMGLPEIDGRTTRADVLERFVDRTPFAGKMLKYRKVQKLYGTYAKGMVKHVEKDGHIRTTFLLHGTKTGRLSSSSPNLQNIPREPKTIKKCFVAHPGKVMVEADFSQAELRVLAVLSKDEFLLDTYRQGKDLHDEVATMLFGSDFTDYQRTIGKSFSFGLIYGRGAAAIAAEYGMSVKQAQQMMDEFLSRMPRVERWVEKAHEVARSKGYIETRLGRRRRFPLITSRNLDNVMRQAQNFPCQSLAGDLTLKSLIEINNAGIEIIGTVHDSVIYECKPQEVDETFRLCQKLSAEMAKEIFGDEIPFPIDAKVGPSWGEMEEHNIG